MRHPQRSAQARTVGLGVARSTPPPIGDYGLLGDTRTAALVSSDGAIDWLCVPRFDGAPVFGRLVGGPPAGTFRAGPAAAAEVVERHYRRHTATLETTWAVGERRLTLTEAMVAEVAGRLLPATVLLPLVPGVHPRMASHRAGPASTAVLEPPGLLALNYGIQTPAVAIVAHLVYGSILGLLLQAR